MIDVRQRLALSSEVSATYYSLPVLEKMGVASVSRLAVCRCSSTCGDALGILPYVLDQLLAQGAREEATR